MIAFIFANTGFNFADLSLPSQVLLGLAAALVGVLLIFWLTTRYIPNQQVGVVEKLWSATSKS